MRRRTPAHARSQECLADQMELLRCYYDFVRLHGGLKFGREVRTPAMQAGLTERKLSFRDVFTATARSAPFVAALLGVRWSPRRTVTPPAAAR